MNHSLVTAAAGSPVSVAEARQRVVFEEPIYDRFTRGMALHGERHSVGTDDVLIVEGVPALCLPTLSIPSRTLKLFVSESEEVRLQRLKDDYTARGYSTEQINQVLKSRAGDETTIIRNSAESAKHVIQWRSE